MTGKRRIATGMWDSTGKLRKQPTIGSATSSTAQSAASWGRFRPDASRDCWMYSLWHGCAT